MSLFQTLQLDLLLNLYLSANVIDVVFPRKRLSSQLRCFRLKGKNRTAFFFFPQVSMSSPYCGVRQKYETHSPLNSSTLKITINITLPSGNDSVLCSKTMYSAIFYAKSNNTTTFSIFHQQVQGKIFNKVAGIISQRLEENKE